MHFVTQIGGFAFAFQLTADNDTIYVSDVNSNQVKSFQVVNNSVNPVRTYGSPGASAGQFNGPEQVAIVGNDVFVADFGNNRIQRFDKSTSTYISQFGSTGSGNGQFINAAGLVYNPSNGLLYASDLGNDRVQVFTTSGSYMGQFGSPGSGNGQLNNPWALAVDQTGNIYVADSGNNRISKFTASGSWIRNIATGVNSPLSVAVDRADVVWVTSTTGDIYAYDARGAYLAYYYGGLAGSSSEGYFETLRSIAVMPPLSVAPFNGSPAIIASDATGVVQLFAPSAQPIAHPGQGSISGAGSFNGQVAFDSAQNVYVTSIGDNKVYKFDRYGSPIMQWGTPGSGNGQLNSPYGIAIDDSDFVYVVDRGNSRVQKFDSNGNYVLQFGSAGSGNGQFSSAAMIATDGAWLYVTEEGNDRVQKFSLTGGYVRQWGSSGTANGQFNNPAGIAVDRNRNQVYVSEFSGARIQQFSVFGDFIKVVADSVSIAGLAAVRGLATDQRGNLYVVDGGSSRVIQLNDNGTYLGQFPAANPNGLGFSSANNLLYIGTTSGGDVLRIGSVFGKSDTVGVYRPSSQAFLLRSANSAGSSSITAGVQFALSSDLPITGDWNGDGVDTPGLYRPSTSTFYLWDRWLHLSIAVPDYVFSFGNVGDRPKVGDWNGDGRDSVGTFRPGNLTHYLRNNLTAGAADYAVVFGQSSDLAVAGDWNSDGTSNPGVFRPSDALFHVSNRNFNGAVPDEADYPLGVSGDSPLTADWTHSGYSGLGVFSPSTAMFKLKYDLNSAPPDLAFVFGLPMADSIFINGFENSAAVPAADVPLGGNWGSIPE